MSKPTIVSQLSWPIPANVWLHDRAQCGWTAGVTQLRDRADVTLLANADAYPQSDAVKDGCPILFRSLPEQLGYLVDRQPDVILWNDFPEHYRHVLDQLPRTRHVMRMWGDYQRFWGHFDIFARAHCFIVPFEADAIRARSFGVKCPIRVIPFGIDVGEMWPGKLMSERNIDFASPANVPGKGSSLWWQVSDRLTAMGYRCKTVAGMGRHELADTLGRTKVFFAPSAHEGMSRVVTEAYVAGCQIAVAAEADSMVIQAGLQGGIAVRTWLLSDPQNLTWTYRRDPAEVAKDLVCIRNHHDARSITKAEAYRWDIDHVDVALLATVLHQSLP